MVMSAIVFIRGSTTGVNVDQVNRGADSAVKSKAAKEPSRRDWPTVRIG
jgi:hypothetical protein